MQQAECCRNLIFRRNSPIHKIFERSCDLGTFRMLPDKITRTFGFRIYKRLPGDARSRIIRF